MLGQAGFMTGIKEDVMEPMIDLVKNVEPGMAAFLPFLKSKRQCVKRERKKRKLYVRSAVSDVHLKYGQKDGYFKDPACF